MQHRSGCARQTGENLSRRSEGGSYSCNCNVFDSLSSVRFCSELFFIFILQHRRTVQLAMSSDILYERELYKQFVPSQLTRVHDVLLSPSTSPGRSWLGCSPKSTAVSFFTTNSCGLHRFEPHVSQERKSAHAAGTSLNSSVDPFRTLLTLQAWALHYISRTQPH